MKNFVLEFTNSEWTLYQYDEDLNNLPDIKGSKINKYFNLPDLAYWECEKLSIVANWDNIEEVGEINIELTGDYGTYPNSIKVISFEDFMKKIDDIENIINEHLTDVASYEYERRYPYKSRGLSMEDFL